LDSVHGVRCAQPFDCGYLKSNRICCDNLATAHSIPIQMDRTRATGRDTTPIFHALNIQHIAQNPQQGHVVLDVNLVIGAIYV
jgi:hypothetical protein